MECHPTLPHKRQREVDERAASNANGMRSHISTDMVQLFYCLFKTRDNILIDILHIIEYS